LVTVTGDHDRPEWLITINGIRKLQVERDFLAGQPAISRLLRGGR